MSQQLRDLSIKVFEEASAAELEEAVATFFSDGGEQTDERGRIIGQARMVSWSYQVDGGTHVFTLIYAE